MMTEFERLFNDSVVKLQSRYKLSADAKLDFHGKGIDIENYLKHQISQELAKELVNKDKLDIFKMEHLYDWFISTELFVSSRERMFNIFKSFNDLPEEKRNSFVRWLSPDEEVYINQVRQDNLNKIFSPYPNNI